MKLFNLEKILRDEMYKTLTPQKMRVELMNLALEAADNANHVANHAHQTYRQDIFDSVVPPAKDEEK